MVVVYSVVEVILLMVIQAIIEFIQISTLGNSSNLVTNTLGILSAGNSDATRGTFSGGFDPFR